jgi:O-antigen ligase
LPGKAPKCQEPMTMTAPTTPPPSAEPVPARLAKHALLLFVVLLPFMQPALPLFGLEAVAADAAYLVLAALWALSLAAGAARLRWHPAFWLLGLYFAAMALSAVASEAPRLSAVKLATQAYLLSLPVIVFSLVGTERELRALFAAWLAATAIVALTAVLSVAAFFIDPGNPLFAWAINDFGTLPPGHYPRLRVTFLYAAMLCNYLTVSLMILLAARQLGWIGRRPFLLLLGGILFAAAFSLTPGLGGVFLAVGLWVWLQLQTRRPGFARLALAGGLTAACLFVLAMAVTPILHPTAPFLIPVPGTEITLAPAVRLMAWIEAARNFAADPLLGRGLGMPAVDVQILIPRGEMSGVTDAHNTFLNVAVQCGLLGLTALVAILIWVARNLQPLRPGTWPADVLRLALAFAFLNAFAYQGLGGSFEDARHLWLLFGLILVADSLGSARKERAA